MINIDFGPKQGVDGMNKCYLFKQKEMATESTHQTRKGIYLQGTVQIAEE